VTSAELVDCNSLPPGSVLEIETRNRQYHLECLGGSEVRVSGHPDHCPTPVPGRVLSTGLIQKGKHLHLMLDDRRPLTTTRVMRLRVQRPTVQ